MRGSDEQTGCARPSSAVATGSLDMPDDLRNWHGVHGTPACGLSCRAGSASSLNLFADSSSRTTMSIRVGIVGISGFGGGARTGRLRASIPV
jgi:hypothetical protein